ncbi:MAG: DUF2892 domain-containing protein [Sinobacteraceae bacterium]|nr:DUF2892 domain-containing protein [Nevskiaceae bacterium]
MAYQTGNLSTDERRLSTLYGVGLALVALQRGSSLVRFLSAIASAGLFVRAASGHCAIKAAVQQGSSSRTSGLPGSQLRAARSEAVDSSLEESFPASDAPASRLPDEPPVNAEAKWEAARNSKGNGGPG